MHSSTSVSGTFAKSSRESVTWQQGCIQRWDTNTLSTVARSQQILDQNKDRHRHKFSTICEQNAVLGIRSSNFGSLVFCQKSERMSNLLKKWAICSLAHFWWATWAICSQSLIPSERPEQISHSQKELANLLLF